MLRILPAMMFCAGVVSAQVPSSTLPSPRVTSVFPSGGTSGGEVEVSVRGTDLDEPGGLRFTHAGLTAEMVSGPEPGKKDPAVKGIKNRGTPTEARFKIRIAKDVPAGVHEVRLAGKFGISNPRAFSVSGRPEATETEPNSDVPQAQAIAMNSVMNGVIEASTDVDYFQFAGKKGQRVLAHVAAGSIDSRARPFVELYAADGRTRLASNRNYRGTDALCDCTLPSDGEYFLRISEFAYTGGGQDYFYRLTLTDGPWLDAIWPPMIEAGTTQTVTLIGRGLKDGKPAGTIDGQPMVAVTTTLTAPKNELGFAGLMTLPQACGLAEGFAASPSGLNPLPMFFANAPVVLEAPTDNDTPEKAQLVKWPCEIAGCLSVKNDRDCYRFDTKKGEPVMLDLQGERIGTAMDGMMSIRDANGKPVAGDAATLDDDPEALHPTSFFNRTTDPAPFRFVPPTDGSYTVTVSARDANVNYGLRSVYRLRLSVPRPDFRAVAMARHRDLPSGMTVTPAGEAALDVFVQRLDGFSGPVTVTLANLPAGVTAKPTLVGTGQRWGMIVLSGSAGMKSAENLVTATATAMVEGKDVSRPVASASITWVVPGAQNQPTLTRLDRGLMVASRPGEKLPVKLVAKLDKAVVKGLDGKDRPAGTPVTMKSGETLELPVAVLWQGEGGRTNNFNIDVEATNNIDKNINPFRIGNNQSATVPKDKNDTVISLRARENGPPGYYTIHLRGDTKASMTVEPGKPKKEHTLVAYAEHIAVTVLPTALGKIALINLQVKPGKSEPLPFRVERAFDYSGEYQCKFNFPAGSGLNASDVTIPAGETSVKTPINAAADAKVGNVSYTMTYTAKFDGKHVVTHETKGVVSVGK